MRIIGQLACAPILLLVCGCAERTLTITSEPPGAIVYINGPDETLRTPGKYDFEFYGNYDVVLRKDGYQALSTSRKLKAPLLFIPPFDLIGELFGAKDRREWHFVLTPAAAGPADPSALIARGQQLAGELRSSQYTRKPSTLPTTAPAAPSR